MRRAKRMSIIFAAIAIVTTLLASSYPAQAQQQFEVICSPSGLAGSGETSCEGSDEPFEGEVFICEPETGSVGTPSTCTHAPNGLDPTGEAFNCEITAVGGFGRFIHTCGEAPPGGGGGGDNGGGGGGDNGGGGATPITQEGEQEAEAGEIDQTFDVS